MATRLDEGLEDFFSRRVMDESSRCGTSTQAHFQQAPRPWGAGGGACVCPAPMEASPMTVPKANLWDISPHVRFRPSPPSHISHAFLISSGQLSKKDGPPQWDGGDRERREVAGGPGLG